jgi:hypothetical protein
MDIKHCESEMCANAFQWKWDYTTSWDDEHRWGHKKHIMVALYSSLSKPLTFGRYINVNHLEGGYVIRKFI